MGAYWYTFVVATVRHVLNDRSGTLSIATFLNSIGISAVHEKFKQHSVVVSWLFAAPPDFSGQFSA